MLFLELQFQVYSFQFRILGFRVLLKMKLSPTLHAIQTRSTRRLAESFECLNSSVQQ